MNQADEFREMFYKIGVCAARSFFSDVLVDFEWSDWGFHAEFEDHSEYTFYF